MYNTLKTWCISILFCSCMLQGMERNMAVMMGAQIGASIANQTVNEMYSDMASALTKSNSNITSAINQFTAQIKTAYSAELKTSFHLFSLAQNHIVNLLSQQQAALQQMDIYIQKALSLQQPQINFLTTPATYDQFFTLGSMYTPNDHLWKNLFPVGNWEYDEHSDSFWQMSYAPFLTSTSDGSTTSDKAANNSIFTEWFTRTSSYQIECEITVYQIKYPFFIGLIFNKARWISGDTTRIQKYRLFGLYGNENNVAQVCFAEPYQAATGSKEISYPLERIIAGKGILNIPFNSSDLQKINIIPVTYRLKVITSPSKIECKFWPSSAPEPSTFITIQSNNPDLYLYHGIGFISPGAIAQFKLIQPTSLLFSLASKQTFKAEVQAFLEKEMVQLNVKKISNTIGVS